MQILGFHCDREDTMISKTAEYALRAVACLAGSEGSPLVANILAKKTKIPRSYLHTVLQDLAAAGLIRSRPGPGGGYELCRAPKDVTILDVVNAVAPIERIRHCPLGLPSHRRLCPLHRELDRAFAATERAFRAVTLKDVMRSGHAITPLCDIAAIKTPQPCAEGHLKRL